MREKENLDELLTVVTQGVGHRRGDRAIFLKKFGRSMIVLKTGSLLARFRASKLLRARHLLNTCVEADEIADQVEQT